MSNRQLLCKHLVFRSSCRIICDSDSSLLSPRMLAGDCQKSRYVSGLVGKFKLSIFGLHSQIWDLYLPLDQAVKPICNIWNPQDIPFVFLTSSRPTMATASTNSILVSLPSISLHGCNTQLPSPGYIIFSDNTAISHAHLPDVWFKRSAPTLQRYAHERVCSRGSSLFSHVRQCYTGSALQAALCYLDAICRSQSWYHRRRVSWVHLQKGIS
jgi:hypothetical protein